MTIEEKKNLLTRNIWSTKEAKEYFEINTYFWNKLSLLLPVDKRPLGCYKKVYRDDVFSLLNTSLDKEKETLKNI